MNRKQRRTKNNGHLHNASMAAQAMVLQSNAVDIAMSKTKEHILQRSVVALHLAFGFGKDRIDRYIKAMNEVSDWLNELGEEYVADAQLTGNRAKDKKQLNRDANEYVCEKLREEAQKYTNVELQSVADVK